MPPKDEIEGESGVELAPAPSPSGFASSSTGGLAVAPNTEDEPNALPPPPPNTPAPVPPKAELPKEDLPAAGVPNAEDAPKGEAPPDEPKTLELPNALAGFVAGSSSFFALAEPNENPTGVAMEAGFASAAVVEDEEENPPKAPVPPPPNALLPNALLGLSSAGLSVLDDDEPNAPVPDPNAEPDDPNALVPPKAEEAAAKGDGFAESDFVAVSELPNAEDLAPNGLLAGSDGLAAVGFVSVVEGSDVVVGGLNA